ncbi:uncharacterized protein MICPUCDRAFT_70224 [Micromonas pusilla CCMP1545]|uniref:Predicted protein n=2 Tax=Micromonas pusilla TaxID=38833 RepID=C1N833_MICPC|nr:uncharacterized protein MICPUCDRAFT_70224 [Micromonas pusilla CCMP1545]EEH51632.1 predicted protein [Micromonas pusilla CCMP1545]|eukprot:XP_003064010.1 predicted protein [Micromonas pusilla CCMP1545]
MVKLSKMNKSQKVLLAYAALYAVYSLFWLGEMVGLQDAGLKFFGKRAGKIQVSAATWGGVGGLTLALDHVFAALKCSKDVAQRTVLVTLLGCFFRLGAFASQGSQKWGGALVHSEFVAGGVITIGMILAAMECLRGGLTSGKHPIFGCKGLTHGNLILLWAMMFFYVVSFIFTDFIGDNYVCGKTSCRISEPRAYDQMAWTISMWVSVMVQIPMMLSVATKAEQQKFALQRLLSIVFSIYVMHSEKDISVPSKYLENLVAMGVMFVLCLTAGLGDKIMKPKKAKRAAAANNTAVGRRKRQ